MKIIAFALLVVATNAIDQEILDQIKQKMIENVESCGKEVSATSSDITEILNGKIPVTHEGQCVFFCIHKMYNAQREDGSLNMEGALSNLELIKDLDEDIYNKVYNTFKDCESAPTDSDPCVYATNLVECIAREGKAHGLKETIFE